MHQSSRKMSMPLAFPSNSALQGMEIFKIMASIPKWTAHEQPLF